MMILLKAAEMALLHQAFLKILLKYIHLILALRALVFRVPLPAKAV
ncbi:unnamed protein product [Coffea canephora]|uniref:Uncharacterized protein n=1 Tax=Coffea canephora TaxID=49390 RepID=A0A068UM04_COFCA|nr:unnamed protein product [Coffea canephora]